MTYRKKLIEVSLPLEAINKEAAREKSIRHGHPSTLHMWWARRPLAACRAVLFSSLVDDPSEYMPDEESARVERERLFDIIEELVKWENSNNEEVLDRAKMEIARSVARNLGADVPVGKEAIREFLATKAPPVLDPFAGGGSIPLEAQRLGLRPYASDLNPVAVLINKALIEIPPKFANMPPIHPPEEISTPKKKGKKGEGNLHLFAREWKGAQGLAEDVRYYGKWMRDEAFKRIGHLYPPVTITQEMLADRSDLKEQGLKPGDELTVIAWLWARTVKCPNPACGAEMPLVRSLELSSQKNKKAWLQPVITKNGLPRIEFVVKVGKGNIPTSPKVGRGAKFRCLACEQIASDASVREEFREKRDGYKLISIVVDGPRGRFHISAPDKQVKIAKSITSPIILDEEMNTKTPNLVSGRGYGITKWEEVFTERQLVILATLLDILQAALLKINNDALNSDKISRASLKDYSNAIIVYLAECLSKFSTFHNKFSYWRIKENKSASGFGKQALAMTWDFAEINPFAEAGGDFAEIASNAAPKVLSETIPAYPDGIVKQNDATSNMAFDESLIVSTDPPYYDNIGYADLSDFFYLWLRRALNKIYPSLFSTILVPKSAELVAEASRFDGNADRAREFFEVGLSKTFSHIRKVQNDDFPFTVFYAFKQTENDNQSDFDFDVDIHASTGWETMLEGLLKSQFEITGTWPMRTENETRILATGGGGTNALASSIVLVCRPRPENAPSTSRREFLAALKKELAPALRELQQGSIAPVDLAQAAIGPGMAVFSRYSTVLEADGTPMSVRTALGLINQALDEYLSEQEGEYDGDTRWALSWYEQFGHNEAAFGVAETLSKAKNTSVNGLVEAGILEARGGKVRLLGRDELDHEWDPTQDKRPTAWEAVQHLIYALENEGEESAAGLLAKLGPIAEPARDLAYRLYTVCERKGWAQDALGYNMLVVAWPRLKELAAHKVEPSQGKLM